ncbi:MAG: NUDIX hydrolase [Bacteroidota bacterium]
MSKKIFIENTIFLLSKNKKNSADKYFRFEDLQKMNMHAWLQKSKTFHLHQTINIWGEKGKNILEFFKSNLIYIEAAGGLVKNELGEILFIYRKNKWDLPKGKPEGKENIKETAIREVMEECGIGGLTIEKKIPSTYHIYKCNSRYFALKKSIWFLMHAADWKDVKLQYEEEITDYKWIAPPVPASLLKNAFPSVKDLITKLHVNNKGI